MSLPNPESVVTEQRLNEFYGEILPYLGRTAEAGFTPVGTIIAVMGNSAPTNYLACNGQTVNIADYPELAAYFKAQFGSANYFGGDGTTTFAICDLRGEFLRGTGTNGHTNEGNGSNVGVHQNATKIPFVYTKGDANHIRLMSEVIGTSANSVENVDKEVRTGTKEFQTNAASIASWDSSGCLSKYASRPTNTSVLYCIATKNIYLNPSLDYSTDEKVVGHWIDGKAIYQKTIVETMPDATTLGTIVDKAISIGVAVDTFVNYQAMLLSQDSSNTYFIPLSNHATTATQSGSLNELFRTLMTNNNSSEVRKNMLHIRNGLPGWNGATIYVTLQYTKVTS